ncbi:hypothetical protein H6G25_06455 [Dolichospermum sp. FACHB-1091]|uniref:hypothetical protein n=1 Tax=Dolichospermum sp. FACHB-1091 TaxID=2692798 RepID=UPI0016817D42|nr:hypothetical protein [Dolichospermum sp. FACHB-1091]MBD2442846.1 hypothetical protein [Dolichospermum sp. FACHB-1091]
MSNLFTVVSAEQQEIVAGGRRNIKLDVVNRSFRKVTFGFKQKTGGGHSSTEIDYLNLVKDYANTSILAPANVLS